MQEGGRRLGAEQARQMHLAAGRVEQVFAANHVRDALREVVDRHGELIGPEPMAVADEDVAALPRGRLHLGTEPAVAEVFVAGLDADANAETRTNGQSLVAARSRIHTCARSGRGEVLARTVATIDEFACLQAGERVFVNGGAVALPGRLVGDEAQPCQIFAERAFVLGTASLAVVILDAQHHAPTQLPRDTPDVDGVEYVPEMQIAGWRRREARDHAVMLAHRRRRSAGAGYLIIG